MHRSAGKRNTSLTPAPRKRLAIHAAIPRRTRTVDDERPICPIAFNDLLEFPFIGEHSAWNNKRIDILRSAERISNTAGRGSFASNACRLMRTDPRRFERFASINRRQ